MSEGSGQNRNRRRGGRRGRRRSVPKEPQEQPKDQTPKDQRPTQPDREDPQKAKAAGTTSPPARPKGPVHLRGPAALERLRDRVEEAVHELERLREANTALVARLQEVEARAPYDEEDAVVSLGTDPKVIRQKVDGFIAAIDAYLAHDPAPTDEDEDSST